MQQQTNKATKKIVAHEQKWYVQAIRLAKYMKKPRLVITIICILTTLSALALIVGTYLAGVSLQNILTGFGFVGENDWIVNPGSFDEDMFFSNFIPILLGMFFSYFLSFIFGVILNILIVRVSQDIGFRLRRELFAKLHSAPFKVLDKKERGDLLSRLTNDVQVVMVGLSGSVAQIFQGIIQSSLIVIALFLIAPIIATVITVLIPTLFLFIIVIIKKGMPFFAKQQITIGNVNSTVENFYSGHKVIKTFDYNKKALQEFNIVSRKHAFVEEKAVWISGSVFPYNNFISNLLIAIVIFFSALYDYLNFDFYTTLPGLDNVSGIVIMSIFTAFMRNLTSPISTILSIMPQIQTMLAGMQRTFEIVDLEEEPVEVLSDKAKATLKPYFDKEAKKIQTLFDTKQTTLGDYEFQMGKLNAVRNSIVGENESVSELLDLTQAHVRFDNICFSYEEGKPILKNISFEAKPGTSNAIVGKTGSGKTTIISLLARYYELDSGKILVDNQDIAKVAKYSLRNNITVVLQDTFLFNETIRENIRYGNQKATEEEIVEAAKLSNAWFFIQQLPEGLDTVITSNANLSEGQKQLLAIARAFLSKAKIIILDEATSYVDTKTEKQIQEGMAKLMQGRTSFVIAHRLSTIKNSDNIIVIDHGKLVEQGTHDQLLKQKGYYAKLNESSLVDEN